MLLFRSLDSRVRLSDAVGLIPAFLSDADPRDAISQIDERYAHGGGWWEAKVGEGGWRAITKYEFPYSAPLLKFPGDAPIHPLAIGVLHPRPLLGGQCVETIVIYESGWTAVFRENGDFRLSRLD